MKKRNKKYKGIIKNNKGKTLFKTKYQYNLNTEDLVHLKMEFCMTEEDYEELFDLCKYYKINGGIHELLQSWLEKENGDEFDILIRPYE